MRKCLLVAEHSVGVKYDGLVALNKTHTQIVQVEGSDPNDPTYAGVLEVFHQMHCLVSTDSDMSYVSRYQDIE